MKKSLSCCVIAIFLVLAACQTNTSDDSAKAQEVTLKFTTWTSSKEISAIFDEFMKEHPGIGIREEVLDNNHYDVLLKTKILSGDPPDVLLLTGQQYYNYANLGWLADITDAPAGRRIQNTKLSDVLGIRGKDANVRRFFGAPVSGGPNDFPVFYNKRYFEKLGLAPPTSLDEFYAICDTIKADGAAPLVIGISDRWPLDMLMGPFIDAETLGAHPELSDDLYFDRVLPSEAYRSSLTFIDELMKRQYIGKASMSLSYKQSLQAFVSGKAAMLPMGGWAIHEDEFKQANLANFELGVFSFPFNAYGGKKHLGIYLQSILGVNSNSKHPQEARAFFDFLMEEKQLTRYIEGLGWNALDPTLQIRNDSRLSAFIDQHRDAAQYDIHYLKNRTIMLSSSFSNAVEQSIYNIVGGSPIETELRKLDEAMAAFKDEANGIGIARSWGFHADGDTEGWSSPNASLYAERGSVHILSQVAHPYMDSPDLLDIPAAAYPILRIGSLSDSKDVKARVYFTTREDNNWNDAKSVAFDIEPNVEKEYVIDMRINPQYRGLIRRFRIFPFTGEGTASIDFINVTAE